MLYVKIIVLLAIPALIWLRDAYTVHVASKRLTKEDIDRIAAELISLHGDQAEEVALIREDRAWRDSDSVEQRKWRRVRRALVGMRAVVPLAA